MGYSQHSGMVICCDGSDEMDKRIERTLNVDPGMGVVRHATLVTKLHLTKQKIQTYNFLAYGDLIHLKMPTRFNVRVCLQQRWKKFKL